MGEFVQLVKKSKERGYYTIVCDNYPDGPARTFADEDYVIPVTATEEIAQQRPLTVSLLHFLICFWNAW